MDSGEWKRVEAVLDEVLDLAPAERAAAARRLCGDDEALRRRVDEILEAVQASRAWLSQDALRLARDLLADRDEPSGPSDPPAR